MQEIYPNLDHPILVRLNLSELPENLDERIQ